MESNPKESLIKAGKLIREGRTKSARAILLQVLREDQENAQAWFMLSYTIPDLEKQIYAVKQALIHKPDSAKAQQRLIDLGGDIQPDQQTPDAPLPSQGPSQPEEKDYSQPIFPSTDETLADENEETAEEITADLDPLESLRNSVEIYQNYRVQEPEPEFTPRVDEIKKEVEEKEKKSRVFGFKRIYFLVGAGALILVAALIAMISPRLKLALSNPHVDVATETATNTETPITEPSATPELVEPTITNIPTEIPAPTPQSVPDDDVFNWNTLSLPSGIAQAELDSKKTQLQNLLGTDTNPEIRSFFITEPELQGLIRSFSKLPQFSRQVILTHDFYQAVGLASPEDDFDTLYSNYWADPNGTLAIPQDKSVATFGYEFSDYQKYSYVMGITQIIRQAQFPDAPIFSLDFPCYLPAEKCDIWNMVVKGEAAFTAFQWAQGNMDLAAFQSLADTTVKDTFTPFSSIPTDLMNALIKSPYQIGYDFAEAIYQAEGTAGLENIYTNPPKSMEQILHPEKYLSGEEPVGIIANDIGDFLGDDWSPLYKGPIGEWKTYLILTYHPNPLLQLDQETARRAAAGWNGDLTQIYTSSIGENTLVFHWAWDSAGEQSQFEAVLREHASQMVAGLEAQYNEFTCEKSATQTSCIIATGEETIWLLTPDMETMSLILDNYTPISSE
jgi:hypothetical protein